MKKEQKKPEKNPFDEKLPDDSTIFRTFADESPNMVFLNSRGRVVYANLMCEEVLGYTRAEICSPEFDFMALIAPEYREVVGAHFSKHQAGEEVSPYEYVIVTKDGRRLNTIITSRLVPYKGEKAILGIVTDITEIKRAEVAARETEKLLTSTMASLDGFIAVVDRDLRVVLSNWKYHEFVSDEERQGKPHCYRIFKHRDTPCENCPPLETFADGEARVYEDRNPVDGRFMEIRVTPIFDDSGNVAMVMEYLQDITRRKSLEAELQKAQKLESVGILAGGIAHDFNNLLQAVVGNVSMARMNSEKGGSVYQALGEAEKAIDRTRHLTQQLLTFSKGGAPVTKALSLNPLLRELCNFSLSGSNVRCDLAIADDLWSVEADAGQVSQVFQNLIINADQAMPEGGTIVFRAGNTVIDKKAGLPMEGGRYVKLTIHDTGGGIPEGHLPKIFDPYFTTKQKGSGLGLSVCYSIIKKHGGHITAESELGAGTTFAVYLPASDKDVDEMENEEGGIIAGRGKILFMDDEESVRITTATMFALIGYEADFAKDGDEAIEMYGKARDSSQPYDAVMLDITVPGGTGGEGAMKKLLELDPGVRAIVTSGYADSPLMANFREYGFSGSIAKPYTLACLSKILHKVATK